MRVFDAGTEVLTGDGSVGQILQDDGVFVQVQIGDYVFELHRSQVQAF